MIIVEGPDGSGKTTLVKMLADELSYDVAPKAVNHDTSSTVGNLSAWVDDAFHFHPRTLFDRHALISEPIYGPVFRGGVRDDFSLPGWYSGRWRVLLTRRPTFIICLPAIDVVMENLRNDEDNVVVRDKQPLVWWQYWRLVNTLPFPCLHYDYTTDDLEDTTRTIQLYKVEAGESLS